MNKLENPVINLATKLIKGKNPKPIFIIEDDSSSEEAINEYNTNILSADYFKTTEAYKKIKNKETQIKYYKNNNTCDEVLQLVDLESKPFGA